MNNNNELISNKQKTHHLLEPVNTACTNLAANNWTSKITLRRDYAFDL